MCRVPIDLDLSFTYAALKRTQREAALRVVDEFYDPLPNIMEFKPQQLSIQYQRTDLHLFL